MLEVTSVNKEENMIFFLKGNLTKKHSKTFNNKVIKLTKEIGLKNILFDTSNVDKIDIKGIHNILKTYVVANEN